MGCEVFFRADGNVRVEVRETGVRGAPGQFVGDVRRGLAGVGGDGRDLGLGTERGLGLGMAGPVVIAATSAIVGEMDFFGRPEVLDVLGRAPSKCCCHLGWR